MQLRYVFSELVNGLRRNLSMHLAVILTLFVSLTLVGLGVLMNQQADKAAGYWGSQLEIAAVLCTERDSSPNCSGEVTDAQRDAVIGVVEENPEVADYRTESKEEAFEKVKELLGPEQFEGPFPPARVEAMPQSVWIELKDPQESEGITSAVKGLDGVATVRDSRDRLEPIFDSINYLQIGSIGTAVFLVIAALLLVANTVRLAALARRREIGIMRLVGASSLYITLPFLLEALFTALAGVALAGLTLAAFQHWGVDGALANLRFIPWISWPEYVVALVTIGILGPLLTLVPTLVLTRKYLKV
jgi:cell division transport system permease protein